jgi:hypothetical protein
MGWIVGSISLASSSSDDRAPWGCLVALTHQTKASRRLASADTLVPGDGPLESQNLAGCCWRNRRMGLRNSTCYVAWYDAENPVGSVIAEMCVICR